MVVTTYLVEGMTCDHCKQAVTNELSRIAGVSEISVDLGSGKVRVTSDAPLAESDVRAAIDEAGYDLVGSA